MSLSKIGTVLGLRWPRTGWFDGGLLLLLLLGCIAGVWTGWATGSREAGSLPGVAFWFSVVVYYPVLEELLFRGVLQGELRRRWMFSRRQWAGISVANLLTSLAFIAMHLANHSPGWAVAVGLPSLVFGYYRDRSGSVLYPLVLHAAWNGFFFLGRALAV